MLSRMSAPEESAFIGGFTWQEMAPPFSGSKARMRRAAHHLSELDIAARALLDDLDERIRLTRLPNGDLNVGLLRPAQPHFEIPIMVGEIAHNVRSALNSLVYDLAVSGKRAQHRGGAWTDPQGTQFPIETNAEVFEGRVTGRARGRNVAKYLAYVPRPAVDAIRTLQPFEGCEWPKVLQHISNQDKHRFLSELRVGLEMEFRAPAPGQEEVEMELGLRIYLHPWVVSLPDTLRDIVSAATDFINLFEAEEVPPDEVG